jgi:hypothetical protein
MLSIILWFILGGLIIILSIYESVENNRLRNENAFHAFINSILIQRLKRYEGDDEGDN